MANDKRIVALPEAVAKEYELINWTGGHRQNFGRFGDIDISKMTPAFAARLVQMGFSKLKKKEKSARNGGSSAK